MEKHYYVYILRCADDTFYTGYTTNLENRLKTHNKGIASKYTRSRLPVTMIYSESYVEKTEALKREYQIKQLSRSEKEMLIHQKRTL